MVEPSAVVEKLLAAGAVRHRFGANFVRNITTLTETTVRREPTLLRLKSPMIVVGDLHGQYSDLLRVFKICGLPTAGCRFLFLGDYVDRGKHSLECLVLLCALKTAYPKKVFLLRGNHEIPSVNKSYGLYGELRERYARCKSWDSLYERFNRLFSYLPLAATIDMKILCLHGGLSPELTSLKQIEALVRPIVEPSGLAECLLWSDPDVGAAGFVQNKSRGVGFCFGTEAVAEKLQQLGVERIMRGHQLADYGYDSFANNRVITIFTASSYHDTFNNPGAIANVHKNGKVELITLMPQYPMTDDEKSVCLDLI